MSDDSYQESLRKSMKALMSLREILDDSSITVRELLGVIAKYDLRESRLRMAVEEHREERMRLLEQLQVTFDERVELEEVKEELRLLKQTNAERAVEGKPDWKPPKIPKMKKGWLTYDERRGWARWDERPEYSLDCKWHSWKPFCGVCPVRDEVFDILNLPCCDGFDERECIWEVG